MSYLKSMLVLSFLFSAFLMSSNGNAAKILATINNKKISLEDFERRYQQNSQIVPGEKPDKKEVLKNIVYFELANQEARRIGLHKDDALREQFDILLYQALIRRKVQPKIDALNISEAEIRSYYSDNPLLRTKHIILLTKPGITTAEKKKLRNKAESILAKVKSEKKSFESYVREYSEGPSAKTGGDVDWGARHKLLPEYYEAALALKKVGDLSEVVETPYGLHIIKLTGRNPYSKIDSVYKDFIVQSLKENKGQKIYDNYFDSLKAKAKVSVNEKLLL